MRRRALTIALAVACVLPAAASAAEWGLIQPGVSTKSTVRARYGPPTRTTRQKVEDKYDTETWIYEGDRAPAGIVRMSVEFGLLVNDKYQPDAVRVLQLEPHGATFNRGVVANGWGFPDGAGRQGEEEFFVYKEGLLVYFHKDGWTVRLMVFTLPQPRDPTEERRR
jgi:hypothetical protein